VVLGTSYLFGVKLLEGLHEALIQRYWSRSQDLFDVAFTKDIGPDHQIFGCSFYERYIGPDHQIFGCSFYKSYWSRTSDFLDAVFTKDILGQTHRFEFFKALAIYCFSTS